MWHLVTRGNIQQISYISQTEQHSTFGLILLCLGNVTIMCVHVCALSLIWNTWASVPDFDYDDTQVFLFSFSGSVELTLASLACSSFANYFKQ